MLHNAQVSQKARILWAALVRQRNELFSVLAVVGLVLAIIAPFMGAGLI